MSWVSCRRWPVPDEISLMSDGSATCRTDVTSVSWQPPQLMKPWHHTCTSEDTNLTSQLYDVWKAWVHRLPFQPFFITLHSTPHLLLYHTDTVILSFKTQCTAKQKSRSIGKWFPRNATHPLLYMVIKQHENKVCAAHLTQITYI